jgi:1,4-dihydroxy-2-naphthoate octaprenyltransferase
LSQDLPAAYQAGLLEAFVALSRADASAVAVTSESFELRYRSQATDRVARLVRWLAAFRVPLLLTTALGVLTGWAVAGPWPWLDGAAVLGGGVAAQAGANGLHALRSRRRGPLDTAPPPHLWLLALTGLAYAVALGAAAWLALTGHPWVLAYAAAGFTLSLAYAAFRDEGLGPFLAGFAHGPLVVLGTTYVLGPVAWPTAILASLPVGLLTAALLHLDDMADRPLDEASGRRTLAVRLPGARHIVAYAVLLFGGLAAAVVLAALRHPLAGVLLAGGILPPMLLAVRHVQAHADDPRRLSGARLATLALHVATSLTFLLTLWSLA